MKGYQYLDALGTFRIEDSELTSYLYFPIANESGVMGCVTPDLGGDNKMNQNSFLLAPVSSEDLHNNKSSRNFWCNIDGKGIWSSTGKSAAQEAALFMDNKDKTILEAGFMWQKVTRKSINYGITSEIISFVPSVSDTVEIMLVSIINESLEPLTFTPTAAIPIYGRSADNIRDHRHVTSLLHRIETSQYGVLVNPTLTFDERGHRKNNVVYGVFGSEGECQEPDGFYPIVEDFIGDGGSFMNPRAIMKEDVNCVKAGFRKDGYEALGGIKYKTVTLNPQESITYSIVMGYGENDLDLIKTVEKYLSVKAAKEAFYVTKQYWLNKINVSYKTGLPDFDNWMRWVNFQPMLRRIYGCSFLPHHDYGKGGRGWRDLWQDCLALLIMNPDGVKEMLIDNFAGVRLDGSNATIIGSKQGEFFADRNNITRVWMDHGVWPFLTTKLYIMQSGDLGLLLKDNYYFKDLQAVRGEDKDTDWKVEDGNRVKIKSGQEYKGSILEHILIQHLTAFYDVGDHGHIRLRGADWNDALDMAKEKGESVAFTALYGDNLEQLANLIEKLDEDGVKKLSFLQELKILLNKDTSVYEDIMKKQALLYEYCNSCKNTISGETFEISCKELADNLKGKALFIKEHIRKTEWLTLDNGNAWYNSYYDNHGRQVEGNHKNGVRMMLTGQVFAIMSKTATDEQVKAITHAADTYLYNREIGGYKLNTDFKEIKTDLGRMFGFAYGSKENGAVFSHMTVMYANALYQRNFVEEGYRVIKTLYSHVSDFEKCRIYPGIPEYIGDNGRGLYNYLTGSASWLLLTVLTEMFGVKGEYGDLLIQPKLMKEQFDNEGKIAVKLVFAYRNLEICYINKNLKEFGEYKPFSVSIDGKCDKPTDGLALISRKTIMDLDEKAEHKIEIELV